MKLRELVNKIDNDTPLFIIWGLTLKIYSKESTILTLFQRTY